MKVITEVDRAERAHDIIDSLGIAEDKKEQAYRLIFRHDLEIEICLLEVLLEYQATLQKNLEMAINLIKGILAGKA